MPEDIHIPIQQTILRACSCGWEPPPADLAEAWTAWTVHFRAKVGVVSYLDGARDPHLMDRLNRGDRVPMPTETVSVPSKPSTST